MDEKALVRKLRPALGRSSVPLSGAPVLAYLCLLNSRVAISEIVINTYSSKHLTNIHIPRLTIFLLLSTMINDLCNGSVIHMP